MTRPSVASKRSSSTTRARPFPSLVCLTVLLASCATFKGEIPVGTEVPDITYISPRNQDGIQDRLVLPVKVEIPYEKMVLGGYRFSVTDGSGSVVYSTEDKTVGEGEVARGAVAPVPVPDSLAWDGRTAAGDWAADGTYTWAVTVWDTKGNSGVTPGRSVVVDNTPPQLTLTVRNPLFSPDEDGNLDTLAVDQADSSQEDTWQGEMRDELGHVERTWSWTGVAPSFAWDGKDATGSTVPDGAYVYSVSARDRAGNSSTFTARGITVDTNPVGVSLGVTSVWLSPNGDGVRDIVQYLPRAALPQTVSAWSLAVRDAAGATRRRYSGAGNLPERIEFDGRDDAGALLADGVYTASLTVTYPNGATPTADAPSLGIDTVAPRIRVTVDYPVFSPDGDGSRDTTTVNQTSSAEERWNAYVMDGSGRVVLVRSWPGTAKTFTWDGRDDAGWSLPDGPYAYHVESTDEAGNTATADLANLRIDRRKAAVTLASSVSSFSPNGDGVLDTVDFYLTARPADGIDEWKLAVTDTQGRVAVSWGARPPTDLPSWIQWDGKRPGGGVVPGDLRAELTVRYESGSVARVALDLTVDLTPPALTARVSPQPFSPDEDGVDDTATILLGGKDPSGIGSWTARILDPEGNLFQQWRGTGAPQDAISWDGRSFTGELVQSATDYTLSYRAVDGAGNVAEMETAIPVDILVLREGERLRIVISSIYFKEFTPDYRDVPEERAKGNLATLDRLADRLRRYPQHTIRIEGHAVSVYWDDPVKGKAEEESVLEPLSLARAEAVRDALVERGIPAQRMTVVGFGGTQPVVPHGDLVNRWKNRRVEFVLERL